MVKTRIKELTGRSRGISMERRLAELRRYARDVDRLSIQDRRHLGGLIRYNLEQLTTTNPTNRTNNPGGFLATYIRSIRAIRGQNLPRFGYFKVPTVKSVGLPIESLVGLTNAWLQKQG